MQPKEKNHNWNVSVEYERETVNLTDFMSQAVYDLEFSTRTLFRDANSSRIILSKEAMVRSSNQETETSKSVFVSGQLDQNLANFTVSFSSRSAISGKKKALVLGIDHLTAGMVKDTSARLRSGQPTAVGMPVQASSNAEADSAAKRILSCLSEGPVLNNCSYMQTIVIMNFANFLWARYEVDAGKANDCCIKNQRDVPDLQMFMQKTWKPVRLEPLTGSRQLHPDHLKTWPHIFMYPQWAHPCLVGNGLIHKSKQGG